MKAKQGVHYKLVTSELSRERTGAVLAALDRRELLEILEANPIERITIRRAGAKQISGEYDWRHKAATINSARKIGIHYGAEFLPRISYSMSAATSDKLESMRRSLLQEVAHHFENSVAAVSSIVRAAFANPSKSPITRYARTSAEEYFAESFVAHIVDPNALAAYDPAGSRMVEQVLALTRNPR